MENDAIHRWYVRYYQQYECLLPHLTPVQEAEILAELMRDKPPIPSNYEFKPVKKI
jgi:hypothetical protein